MQNLSPIKPVSRQPIICGGYNHHKFTRREHRNQTGRTSWVNAGLKAQPNDICKKCGITRREAEAQVHG